MSDQSRRFKTVYLTERGVFHQERALAAAPPELEVIMLRQPSPEELQPHLPDTVYLISERVGTIDADLISRMPALKLILRLGSMTHDIDIDAARAAGVIVCSQPIEGVIRVAEHVVMQMLALAKHLPEVTRIIDEASPHWAAARRTDEDTFAYNWSGRTGIGQLYRRTLGILGFGEIGIELARRLRGWGCTILYNKRRRLPESAERELDIRFAEADALIAGCDYLVNLLPYFPETDMSLNKAVFDKMRPGAYLVSVGSGSVIDETALAEMVYTGRLAGAALDTYEYEPIHADNPLRLLARQGANVILTPHTAAGSYTASLADRERAEDYQCIVRHLRGEL
jgi:phosphoglycerate dehydrogenase-like enzyme